MNPKTESECKDLIQKYYCYKQNSRKIKVRNKLYCIMSSDMQMWVKSVLKKWGRYEEPGEVLSISFDAFLFCLDRYKNGFESIQGHFYEYARYFLLIKYAKTDKVLLPIEELKEILKLEDDSLNNMFNDMLTISQFRESLTREEEKIIWDDACMSLSECHMERKEQRKVSGMSTGEYARLKRVFINQIKLILNIRI